MANGDREISGVVGFFENPTRLISGMRKVREAGYRSFDAFTPFAVHGLDEAQGLKRSPIPFVTFAFGLTGVTLGFLFQWWTSAVDWPVIIAGKPMNSWPAFVPVMFELTILFAGISTFLSVFWFNRLPNVKKKSFDPAITRDRFAIKIDAPGGDDDLKTLLHHETEYKTFSEQEAKDFLKAAGATEVRTVYAERWF